MTFGGINRGDYPTLNPISKDSAGVALTPETIDTFFRRATDPELKRRRMEHQLALEEAANRGLKETWARHLGKSVDELTPEDTDALNNVLFKQWLAYKGVTEQEFWDWIG